MPLIKAKFRQQRPERITEIRRRETQDEFPYRIGVPQLRLKTVSMKVSMGVDLWSPSRRFWFVRFVNIVVHSRYRLHQLKGDRKGFWAVTVRANWRRHASLKER